MRRALCLLSYILVIIGALNWGLWGFFQFDFIAWIFGGNTTGLSRLIYSIIGLAGVWTLASGACKRCCKTLCCKEGECPCCKGGECKCGSKTGKCPYCGNSPCTCGKEKKIGQ